MKRRTGKTNSVRTEDPPQSQYGAGNNEKEELNELTIYIKRDILAKLYGFALWEGYTITEAANIVLEDWFEKKLRGKGIKKRTKKKTA